MLPLFEDVDGGLENVDVVCLEHLRRWKTSTVFKDKNASGRSPTLG